MIRQPETGNLQREIHELGGGRKIPGGGIENRRGRARGEIESPLEDLTALDLYDQRTRSAPVDANRGHDGVGEHLSEITRAPKGSRDVRKQRPLAVGVTMPDRGVADADRRDGKATERQDVARSKPDIQDGVSGVAVARPGWQGHAALEGGSDGGRCSTMRSWDAHGGA